MFTGTGLDKLTKPGQFPEFLLPLLLACKEHQHVVQQVVLLRCTF